MSKLKRVPLFGAVLLPFFVHGEVGGQEFQIDLTRENRVSFLSDAPFGDFQGVTDRVDGFVFLPPGEGDEVGELGESEFFFEVDLASLDTGIGLRNRHLRENYLETEAYPFASFEGRIGVIERVTDGSFALTAQGELSIHGVDRFREIPCRVRPEYPEDSPSDVPRGNGPFGETHRLWVRCAFPVTLSDHGVPIPKLMFMKIDEVMALEVDFHLLMVPQEGT